MIIVQRSSENPILLPSNNSWEKEAAFNGAVLLDNETFHMVYRAQSEPQQLNGISLSMSTIGYAKSTDGIHFEDHRQLIKPEYEWEKYGCEDPRITKIGNKYYIFYTALSTFPFSAPGIKVAVAITTDLTKIEEKHLVTPFNAKAMSFFPEKINGKFAAILTANTDMPPSKIGIALFDKEEELWSNDYWNNWYAYIDDRTVPLQRNNKDQIEIGAAPVKTDCGWLLVYCYIRDYFTDNKLFGIEAVLLDLEDPRTVIWRTKEPMLVPEKDYELYGKVPNVIFPSGALVHKDQLFIYYGGADTTCCVATVPLKSILGEADFANKAHHITKIAPVSLTRFAENPILSPLPQHSWEDKATFNPAAVFADNKIHIVYRAMGHDDTSVMGYASSTDGFHIDERLPEPIYAPREDFEKKTHRGNSGCEDPRITKIGDRFYMCYTAYDGSNPPRVAFTSIDVEDFLAKKWNWEKPKLISPPGKDDKDACVLEKKINGKYVFFHRLDSSIWVDFVDDLEFKNDQFLKGKIIANPRPDKWDRDKIGISAPPIETANGWLLLYHGVFQGNFYKVGAYLLDKNDPSKIIGCTEDPIFEPEMKYEKEGQFANVVFPCGAIVKDEQLFVYYGGADSVVGVATIELKTLLRKLT
jgi:predicted GH43/DUF377 family glycosyl hydrolase